MQASDVSGQEGSADVFNDPTVSVVGKVFLAGLSAALLGHPSRLRVRGSPEQIEAIKDAIIAFKGLEAELQDPEATVQSIMDRVRSKNDAAIRFRDVCGIPWPL